MEIKFKGDYIRLDDVLKISGLVLTGGHAKVVIQNGEVLVDGEVCDMRGKKLRGGEIVEFNSKQVKVLKDACAEYWYF